MNCCKCNKSMSVELKSNGDAYRMCSDCRKERRDRYRASSKPKPKIDVYTRQRVTAFQAVNRTQLKQVTKGSVPDVCDRIVAFMRSVVYTSDEKFDGVGVWAILEKAGQAAKWLSYDPCDAAAKKLLAELDAVNTITFPARVSALLVQWEKKAKATLSSEAK